MKKIFFILMFVFSASVFAQENYSVQKETEKLIEKFFSDSKYESIEVFLREDKTRFYTKSILHYVTVEGKSIYFQFVNDYCAFYYELVEITLVNDIDFKGLRIKVKPKANEGGVK